jgi:hypothetical protein
MSGDIESARVTQL